MLFFRPQFWYGVCMENNSTTTNQPRTIMRTTATGWTVHYGGNLVGTVDRDPDGGYTYQTSIGAGLGCMGWNTNRRAAAAHLVRYYTTTV